MALTTETFKRPRDLSDKSNDRVLYVRSYLRMRLIIGSLGVLLPMLLWLAEGPLLKGDWLLRDSLSSYYHSGARDILVGVLCAVGLLLITYMAGNMRSLEFALSSLAGVMAIGVAFLPTKRPYLAPSAPACGASSDPVPEGCTRVQQVFGEAGVSKVHFICAIVFILSLAVLCFLAALREKKHAADSGHGPFHVWFHRGCGAGIVAALLWAWLGADIPAGDSHITTLYVGEVVAVLAFGASWIVRGVDLLKQLANEARDLIAPSPV